MTSSDIPERLLTVEELAADPRVARLLPKRSALKRHLANRKHNGLANIVHVSPTRRLLIDSEAFVRWLYGLAQEPRDAA